MPSLRLMLLLGAMLLIVGVSHHPTRSIAQTELTCQVLITDAIQQIGSSCAEIGVNEVCYGNTRVSATLNNVAASFDATGDIVDVAALEALVTRPANPATEEWGIALMNLKADLNEGLLHLVMFGGVDVEPDDSQLEEDVPTCQFTNVGADNINLRSGPGTSYRIVDVLDRGDSLLIYGRDESGRWLRSSRGWAFAPLGSLDCDRDTLLLMDGPVDSYVAPMQSFTMQVTDQGQCEAAPSGLLIQAPSSETANILINNVQLRIGSTAFVTINSNNTMIVANLEGNIGVTAQDLTAILPVGSQISVPLDANNTASGKPVDLRPLQSTVTSLSADLLLSLPEPVTLPSIFAQVPTNIVNNPSSNNNTSFVLPTALPITDEWGECGSCNTCGHPTDECVTSPAGACLWSPATCGYDSTFTLTPIPNMTTTLVTPTPTPGYITVPQGGYFCSLFNLLFEVPVSYVGPGVIVGKSVSSTNAGLIGAVVSTLSPITDTLFSVLVNCLSLGNVTINISVTDSLGYSYSTSFAVGWN